MWKPAKNKEPPSDAKGPEDLPIFAHRETIVQHVHEHRITHIQGETGCGKSTQVPKYIMEYAEDMREKGEGDGRTKIVVTQPRRMAAITLARRVASELGEEIGKTVGYKISGDTVSGGKLSFATTGFLLQVLVNQPEEFGTYTHVILDEVHERSVDADLLTMLMKLLLQCYPKVKLIVMSATLQAKLFAEYFSKIDEAVVGRRKHGGPKLEVKPIFVGVRTYPVQELFLDDIDEEFQITGGMARRGLDKALDGFSAMGFGGKGKGGKGKGKKGKDGKGKGKDMGSASGFKRLEPQIAEGFEEVCKELIQQMAREMCTLIVFLPGIADITSFYEVLAPLDASRGDYQDSGWRNNDSDNWRGGSGNSSGDVALKIYPMHSLIPREEQEEVFNPPPKGVCHVVLASNIAESSLTLPMVCGIIDMALRRSIQYDARRLMSCLVTTWCSQSSCKQRSGRAGRTMAGRAVRMVPRAFFEDMVEFDPPEMLNAPLTKLYLQAKQLCAKLANLYDQGIIPDEIEMDLSTPTLLLGEVVQPPSTKLVEAAIVELADVGCLDCAAEDAMITPLGHMAMALPCELRLCRLLYFGLLLQIPCDAIAIVAGLTAADPFSSPSLIVLKDEKEYCKKLERSFGARLAADYNCHSEPLMFRSLFIHWIQAGAPRGPKAMGGFARDWSVIPKKFDGLATEAVDLCTRIVKMLPPRSPGYQALQRLLSSMRFSVDKREELISAQYPSNNDYKKMFSNDVSLLRALLTAGFSDQMLLHLKPRWTPSGGGAKKKKEEIMVEIMRKQKLDRQGTICILNPPQELRAWDPEENHQRLCEAMCGERANRVHWDEKEKLLFLDFKGSSEPPAPVKNGKKGKGKGKKIVEEESSDEDEWPEDAVILDVVRQVHRLHQFGAGRWKFSVENFLTDDWDPDDDNEWVGRPLEILRPLQPFLITWEVLQHAGQEGQSWKKSTKKPSAVKAMPDWRNPVGFACNTAGHKTPQELIGVCASVQGLESGASAFVAGATILGLNFLPLLLVTLDPRKWQIYWGFDAQTYEICAIRIMHYEIILPPETITEDVLWKINHLREKVIEVLTPWEDDDDRRKRRGGPSLYVGDISEEISDLLQDVWPHPEPVVKPKKIIWSSAVGEEVSEILHPYHPFADEIDWDTVESGKQEKSSKKTKGIQVGTKKGISKEQAKGVQDVVNYLSKNGGESWLSSIAGRFKVKKNVLTAYPEFLRVTPLKGENDFTVSIVYGQSNAGGKANGAASSKGSKGKGKGAAKGASSQVSSKSNAPPKSSGKGGPTVDSRIDQLLATPEMPCVHADFDNRVKGWLRGFESRRGRVKTESAFKMLKEWVTQKERDQVRSWPSYLMVLLRNWERDNFTEGDS